MNLQQYKNAILACKYNQDEGDIIAACNLPEDQFWELCRYRRSLDRKLPYRIVNGFGAVIPNHYHD